MNKLAKTICFVPLVGLIGCGTSASSVTAPTTAPVVSVPTSLTSCATLGPGFTSTIGQDLSQSPSLGLCLKLAPRGSVTGPFEVDCHNHVISGISLAGVTDVTLVNCVITGGVLISNSGNVAISNSTISSSGLGAVDSLGAGGAIAVERTTNLSIRNCHVTASAQSVNSAVVSLRDSDHVTLIGNDLNANWDSNRATVGTQGADDGILLLGNEHDDIIQDNTIRNAWDAAIESVGNDGTGITANERIEGNTITNCAVAAVGAYRGVTKWLNNIVRNNRVTQTAIFALFTDPIDHTNQPIGLPMRFENNLFESNSFQEKSTGYGQLVALFGFNPSNQPVSAFGNIIRANAFGNYDIIATPTSGFVITR